VSHNIKKSKNQGYYQKRFEPWGKKWNIPQPTGAKIVHPQPQEHTCRHISHGFTKIPRTPSTTKAETFKITIRGKGKTKKAANIEREHQQGNQIHPRI